MGRLIQTGCCSAWLLAVCVAPAADRNSYVLPEIRPRTVIPDSATNQPVRSVPTRPSDTPAAAPPPAPREKQAAPVEPVRTRPRERASLRIPWEIDGEEIGEIEAWIAEEAEVFEFDSTELLRGLQTRLAPDPLQKLREQVTPEGRITLDSLQDAGMNAEFDRTEVALKVSIPPEIRKAQEFQIYSRKPPVLRGLPLPTADISGYVNARFGMDYVETSQFPHSEGRQPIRTDLEGALNLRRWVVESTLHFAEETRFPWTRGETRLVKDDPEHAVRYSAGDLLYPVTGFQSFQPLLGFSATRNFSLQPYRVTEPLGGSSRFLKTPSRVEVLVNGRPIQTMQLPAGPININSFPFVSGANDVLLRITDAVGHVEIERLSFYFDPRLLKAGEQEFTYNVGLLSDFSTGRIEYETDSVPGVSLYHRWGATDRLTLGLNFQGNDDVENGGAESIWATPIGVFSGDFALSHLRSRGADIAGRVQYRWANEDIDSWNPVWTVGAQYRGPDFATLAFNRFQNPVTWDFNTRYTQRLPWKMHAGVGASYQVRRIGKREALGYNALLSKRWSRNLITDLSYDRTVSFSGQTDDRIFLSFTLLLPEVRQTLIGSHDTLSGVSRLDWQYQPEYLVGGVGASAGIINTPDTYGLVGSARYVNYRSETFVAQDISTPHEFGDYWENRTSFRFGTAMVFADGAWGVSRPVQDSFAIAEAHPGLKHQSIGIDPVQGTYAAQSTRFGPAIVPDLTSYIVRNATLEASNLPPGYELGDEFQTFQPTYRSGTVVRVGRGPIVILEGIIVNPDGVPLSLQAGEVNLVTENRTWSFFTNRKGEFEIDQLVPGTYELRLFSNPDRILHFNIPGEAAGFYKVGELRFDGPVKPQEKATQ